MSISASKQRSVIASIFSGKDVEVTLLSQEKGANGYPVKVRDGETVFLVKIIDPDRMAGKDVKGEIEALTAIDSKRVVKLLGHGDVDVKDEKFYYLLFPFIQGRDLSEIIHQRRASGSVFTDAEIRQCAIQIAEGIKDIWDQAGLVHQDIKPKNIRVAENGDCIILDLGIARFRHEPRHSKGKGSYKYSSPEQIESMVGLPRRISYLADQRSLATILYEMAVEYPFGDGQTDKVIASQVPFATIREKHSQITEGLEQAILKAISRDPCERFASGPQALIDALTNLRAPAPREQKISFYFQQRHSGTSYGYMKDYYSKAAADLWPSGVIFSGAHTPGGEFLEALMPLLNSRFLDPETLPMQSPTGRYARGIAHQPYFVPCRNPAYFAKNPTAIATLAKNVLDKEKSLGSAILITPYFYVASTNNGWWDINQLLYEASVAARKASGYAEPLYAGLALSREILQVKKDANEVLNDLLQIDGLDGCYFMFQSPKAESAASLTDIELLKALRDFIRLVEQKMPVILSYSDIEAIPLSCHGLSSFATNPHPSARRFSEERFMEDNDQEGGNQPRARYYAPGLMNFILRTGALDKIIANKLGQHIACQCPFCQQMELFTGSTSWENKWDPNLANQHYLASIAKEVETLNKIPSSKRRDYLEDRIKNALALYEVLRRGGVEFDRNGDDSFLHAWEAAFYQ